MGCGTSKKNNQEVREAVCVRQFPTESFNLIHLNDKFFLDEYKVLQALGTGSYGEVRTVIHKHTGQERAVKVFRKDNDFDNSYSKVKNEIEILKNLNHPSIIKLYEYFEDEKRLYLVLEKCSGGELFDEITKKKNLNENTSAIICKQLFSAVAYMHENNVIHRDIKPENILLEDSGDFLNIKIIDFGSATQFQDSQKFSELVGSCFYMSPEVFRSNYSKECDMWSCGVILYILLSGYPPFDGKNNLEILNRVNAGLFSFNKPIWDTVSSEAKDLISRLLCSAEKRLTAIEALTHEWVRSLGRYPSLDLPLINVLKDNLKQFQSRNKLHNAISSFITTQIMSSKDTKNLREVFKSLDTNGDGKLSKQELIDGLTRENDLDLITLIMDRVDTDKNGYIDFNEFLVAAVNKNTFMSRENMKKAFDVFDLDASGKISFEELSKVLGLGKKKGKTIWMDVVNQINKDPSEEIDFNEFEDLISQLYQ